MTEPSAALALTASSAIRPPAPGRLSTITEGAYPFMCPASSRATASGAPPGGKPTTRRAGFVMACAIAGCVPATRRAVVPVPADTMTKLRRLSIGFPSRR
jgi:hypothetical protein